MTFQRYCFVTFSIYVNHLAQSNVKWHKNTYCDIKNVFNQRHIPRAYEAKITCGKCMYLFTYVERVHYHIYFNELLVFMCKMLSAQTLCKLEGYLIVNRALVYKVL